MKLTVTRHDVMIAGLAAELASVEEALSEAAVVSRADALLGEDDRAALWCAWLARLAGSSILHMRRVLALLVASRAESDTRAAVLGALAAVAHDFAEHAAQTADAHAEERREHVLIARAAALEVERWALARAEELAS